MSGAQLTRNYWLEEKAEMGQSFVKGILLNITTRCSLAVVSLFCHNLTKLFLQEMKQQSFTDDKK